jgi:hypothetical protein
VIVLGCVYQFLKRAISYSPPLSASSTDATYIISEWGEDMNSHMQIFTAQELFSYLRRR